MFSIRFAVFSHFSRILQRCLRFYKNVGRRAVHRLSGLQALGDHPLWYLYSLGKEVTRDQRSQVVTAASGPRSPVTVLFKCGSESLAGL